MNKDWQEPVDTTVKAAPFKKIIKSVDGNSRRFQDRVC